VGALDGQAWLKVSEKVSKTYLKLYNTACRSYVLEGDSSLKVLRSGTI
jgi:hypothetical protein